MRITPTLWALALLLSACGGGGEQPAGAATARPLAASEAAHTVDYPGATAWRVSYQPDGSAQVQAGDWEDARAAHWARHGDTLVVTLARPHDSNRIGYRSSAPDRPVIFSTRSHALLITPQPGGTARVAVEAEQFEDGVRVAGFSLREGG
jgi:hypothetical protein